MVGFLPMAFHPDRSSVHVEQPHLIAVSATLAVDTDRGQKPGLPRLNKIRSNAEGWSIANVLHLVRTLGDDLVIQ
jgi:hypothetical protein